MTETPPARRFSFDVLGTEISAATPQVTAGEVMAAIEERRRTYLVFCTVSSILCARDDARVRRAIEGAGAVLPDGMPLVWIGRRHADAPIERLYGPDFLKSFLAAERGRYRHFFYGGAPGVAEEMAQRLSIRFPDLQVAGTLSPASGLTGTDLCLEDVEQINETHPDIVWVGLGHPKQELWMHTHRDVLDAPVLAGVGAAFDFLSGRKTEAPAWMKRSGLQWLHRLSQEPRRLWRRYLIGNARFVLLLAHCRLRLGVR